MINRKTVWAIVTLAGISAIALAGPGLKAGPTETGVVPGFSRGPEPNKDVVIKTNETEKRVDITIDGKPFTSYMWPEKAYKPVLNPLRTAKGTVVTRAFPVGPGDQPDHPHHVGYWLTYGDINGVDFWGTSDANVNRTDGKLKPGKVVHRAIKRAKGGRQGELEIEADWVTLDGSVMLKENTKFVFSGTPTERLIDRVTTLTAQDKRLEFNDTKEGMLAIRLPTALEHPSDKPGNYLDASGKPHKVSNKTLGASGKYLSGAGKEGDAVWGTRASWVALSGKVGGEDVTIAMLDHPKNPNHPTFWHARGYGLFALNPFGQRDFPEGNKQAFGFALEPKQSVTMRYRVLILPGTVTAPDMETRQKQFAGEPSTN
jgi:hypothetical protein